MAKFFVRWLYLLPTLVIIVSAAVWVSTGLLDPQLVLASHTGGACGHACADNYSNGIDAVSAYCGSPVAGMGFVTCAEEVTCGDMSRCVYCCEGCAHDPGQPNGCGGGPSPTDTPVPPTSTPVPPPTATCPPTTVTDPTTALASLNPLNPTVAGQSPNNPVTRVTVRAQAGTRTICGVAVPDQITAITVRVRLADSSIAWITTDLARRYPGAQVKGTYPFFPAFETQSTLPTNLWIGRFAFQPLDPGYYQVLIRVRTLGGRDMEFTQTFGVRLLESTLIR